MYHQGNVAYISSYTQAVIKNTFLECLFDTYFDHGKDLKTENNFEQGLGFKVGYSFGEQDLTYISKVINA